MRVRYFYLGSKIVYSWKGDEVYMFSSNAKFQYQAIGVFKVKSWR